MRWIASARVVREFCSISHGHVRIRVACKEYKTQHRPYDRDQPDQCELRQTSHGWCVTVAQNTERGPTVQGEKGDENYEPRQVHTFSQAPTLELCRHRFAGGHE